MPANVRRFFQAEEPVFSPQLRESDEDRLERQQRVYWGAWCEVKSEEWNSLRAQVWPYWVFRSIYHCRWMLYGQSHGREFSPSTGAGAR